VFAHIQIYSVFRKLLLSSVFEGSGGQQLEGNMFCLRVIDPLSSQPVWEQRGIRIGLHSCHIWSWVI